MVDMEIYLVGLKLRIGKGIRSTHGQVVSIEYERFRIGTLLGTRLLVMTMVDGHDLLVEAPDHFTEERGLEEISRHPVCRCPAPVFRLIGRC